MAPATRLTNKLKISNTRVVTAAGAITMVNEGALYVKKAVGAATTVALQGSPVVGDFLFIKDAKGDAATNNIVITPAAGTIDGAATYTIGENYGSVLLGYTGVEWSVQATGNPVAGGELAFLNGVTAGTALASKALVLDSGKRAGTITELAVTTPIVGQGAPAAETGAATISIADILTGIVTLTQSTGATVALTLDTGTAMDTGKPATLGADQAIDWSLINLSAAAADTGTLTAAASGHTIVGNPIVQAAHSSTGGIYGNSAMFRSRRTAANTWVTYRIA